MPTTHLIPPGDRVTLEEIPTRGREYHQDRDSAEKEFRKLRRELSDLQYRLYAEGKRSLLMVLQARDAGGKDGTIRRVFRGVNPQGVRVTPFKAPTEQELSHDFLWRVHKEVPGRGMIRVFNRSHYEDVLIVRVRKLAPEVVWRKRYEHINNFEKLLTDSDTTIVKFYLHVSKEEQRERLQQRIDNPDKHWKHSPDDAEKRKLWEDYTAAYEDAISFCNTPHAPWYVIPADQKWYRNLAISRVLVEELRKLDPQFPPAPEIEPATVIV